MTVPSLAEKVQSRPSQTLPTTLSTAACLPSSSYEMQYTENSTRSRARATTRLIQIQLFEGKFFKLKGAESYKR